MDKYLFGLTQEQRNAQKLFNYIGVANNIKDKYINIYFFLKYYAFDKSFKLKLPTSDTKKINQFMKYFNEELKNSKWDIKNFKLIEYQQFLEYFYSTINFQNIDLNNLFLCRDLQEIIALDELGKKRMQYFDKKLEKFQKDINESQNQNKENQNESNINKQNKKPLIKVNSINNDNKVKNINNNINKEKKETNIKNNTNKNLNIPQFVNDELLSNINQLKDKNSKEYETLKKKIIEHLQLSSSELEYHNIEISKNHIEAVVYYLRKLNEIKK
jgi:hypothetical protein